MKHEARGHALPTSNGWSGSGVDRLRVWCGRCKDTFAPDEDWVRLYYQRRRAEEDGQREYYARIGDPGAYAHNIGGLAEEEQILLGWLADERAEGN